MSITKVEANINNEITQLQEKSKDIYAEILKAPKESGKYDVEISAYDNAGNVSIANSYNTEGMIIDVINWHTPKTNWKPTDSFNIVDYNRIKNNLEYLHEKSLEMYLPFSIYYMGENKQETIEGYESSWDVDIFNFFEQNLEKINLNIFTKNYGISQRFFENAPFIKWDELNRIESACLNMNDILIRQKLGLKKLFFRLGNMKGVKV